MVQEIVAYVPIVDGEEWAEYRSFKNAFFDILGRQQKSNRCFVLERRSNQLPTTTLTYEKVYSLGENTGLSKDGKRNWGAVEPAEEVILAAFQGSSN